MAELFTDVPYAEQIAEVERELALRRRVYPGRVTNRQMTQESADRHIRAMEAVLETVRAVEREAGRTGHRR